MILHASKEILEAEDLYQLQDTFSSSGIPFQYKLTESETGWLMHIKGKYSIADYVLENTDLDGVLTFSDPTLLTEALEADGMHPKAVMLSDETALQKLFFWLG